MKPRLSKEKAREIARAGTLAHFLSDASLHRPLALPAGADPELGRLFGIQAPDARAGDD